MRNFIEWTDNRYKYIQKVYEKVSERENFIPKFNCLERVAVGEAQRLCVEVKVRGNFLTPFTFNQLQPEEKEDLYVFFGKICCDNISIDENNKEIIVECNQSTAMVAGCFTFFLLDVLEYIEERFGKAERKLVFKHALGTRLGLTFAKDVINELYPWATWEE